MPRRRLSVYLDPKTRHNYIGHTCLRCGHFWYSHKDKPYPRGCASCRNYYWDKPRKEKRKIIPSN